MVDFLENVFKIYDMAIKYSIFSISLFPLF